MPIAHSAIIFSKTNTSQKLSGWPCQPLRQTIFFLMMTSFISTDNWWMNETRCTFPLLTLVCWFPAYSKMVSTLVQASGWSFRLVRICWAICCCKKLIFKIQHYPISEDNHLDPFASSDGWENIEKLLNK